MARIQERSSCGLDSRWKFLWVISLMCLTWSSFLLFNFYFLYFPFSSVQNACLMFGFETEMYHISSSFPCPVLLLTEVKGVYFSVHSFLTYSRPGLFLDLIFWWLRWTVDKNNTCPPPVRLGCSFWSAAHFCWTHWVVHKIFKSKSKSPDLFCLTSNGNDFCSLFLFCKASNSRVP